MLLHGKILLHIQDACPFKEEIDLSYKFNKLRGVAMCKVGTKIFEFKKYIYIIILIFSKFSLQK